MQDVSELKIMYTTLIEYQSELGFVFHKTLRDTLFTNRSNLRPSVLKKVAQEQANNFFAFLQNQEEEVVYHQGEQLFEKGLSEETVLQLGQTARQFCLAKLPSSLSLASLNVIDAFFQYLIRGFIRARENNILIEQERVRQALEKGFVMANQRLKVLNERLQGELSMARKIQRSLLPDAKPIWAGPNVISYTKPAQEVGGDLYAYHAFGNNQFAIVVGDVSGKGMPAALLMAVSLASFQTIVEQHLSPAELLSHLDRSIMPYTRTTRQNCAMICVEITSPSQTKASDWWEDTTYTVKIANAGCIAPIVKHGNNQIEWVDVGGTPLGIGLGAEVGYPEVTLILSKGDLLILTSDGVVEAHNRHNELFGFDRLEQAVARGPNSSPEDMLAYLQTEVDVFLQGLEPHDDLTIVVIQI